MPINQVKIKDFLVFKGDFVADFCPGVNVLIGGNGTGKTTLLKTMYWYCKHGKYLDWEDNPVSRRKFVGIEHYLGDLIDYRFIKIPNLVHDVDEDKVKYIPEKDILEHSNGLLPFIEQKPTGFTWIYKDVLVNAQDIPTNNQSETQMRLGQMISGIIGGKVEWDKGDGAFFTVRTDGARIPFANEESGYKRLGLLGILITSGQLEKGSVLFWDEPENSLNPEHIPKLVDILLLLSRSGVQVFVATHSEIFASYFSVRMEKGDSIMFHALYKDENRSEVKIDSNDRFDMLNPNMLTEEPVKLYEEKLERALGGG
jgi:energy-coupling factor transporter ATP-binding protein EcfA2